MAGVLITAGRLILVLLAIVLLLLILVLTVPVRYRLNGQVTEKKPEGTAEISWLAHTMTGRITYHGGKAVSGTVRVFGIRVYRFTGDEQDGAMEN